MSGFNTDIELTSPGNATNAAFTDVNGGPTSLADVKRPSIDFSGQFEYVIVFKLVKNESTGKYEQTKEMKNLIHTMIGAGLTVFPYLSFQKDELIVLLNAEMALLRPFADKLDFRMKLKPSECARILEEGNVAKRIKKCVINSDAKYSSLPPHEYIYGKYDELVEKEHPKLYFQENGDDGFTRPILLKLLYYFIKAPKSQKGCDIEINKLILENHIAAFYPLHNPGFQKEIMDNVTPMASLPWSYDFTKIKDYFGEKIALYFQFTGHYTLWLVPVSLIGIAFNIVSWYFSDTSHDVLPFFGIVMAAWTIIMLEMWKRKESDIALQWGMTEFEDLEPDRPEFVGDKIVSFIDGSKDYTYFPKNEKDNRVCASATVIIVFISLVCGVVASIYVLRWSLQAKANASPYASTIASILNSVQITVFNMIYQVVVEKLTEQENHRTDTMFEDSLISKVFVFQFVNSYASFFFLAFIATNLEAEPAAKAEHPEYVGQCGATSCMDPLAINVAIIFGTRLIVQNTLDILLPYIAFKSKMKTETNDLVKEDVNADDVLTPAEVDYMKAPFNPMTDVIALYADTAVQFGFMTMFAVALPVACVATFINNYAKGKVQIWKVLEMHQRPIPVGAQDIGTWQSILTIIAVIAVATNAGIIVFTMDITWKYPDRGRLWLFIGIQWVLFLLQGCLVVGIDDDSEETLIQKKRMAFIVDKIIDGVPDEDFDDAEAEEFEDVVTVPSGKAGVSGRESTIVQSDNCCDCEESCATTKKITKRRKFKGGYPEIPVLEYPIRDDQNKEVKASWPETIDTKNIKSYITRGATGTVTNASDYAASKNLPPPVPPKSNPLISALPQPPGATRLG